MGTVPEGAAGQSATVRDREEARSVRDVLVAVTDDGHFRSLLSQMRELRDACGAQAGPLRCVTLRHPPPPSRSPLSAQAAGEDTEELRRQGRRGVTVPVGASLRGGARPGGG